MTAATITSTITVPTHRRIQALRSLAFNFDFTDHESQSWKMILVLLERERLSTGLCTSTEVSAWALDTFLSDLRANNSPPLMAWLLIFTLETPSLLIRVLEINEKAIDTAYLEGHTPLHSKIAENFPESVVPGISLLLRRGADPHRVGTVSMSYGGSDASRLDTMTTIAMQRSSAFEKWRRILRNMGYDMRDFVRREIGAGPAAVLGWTEESLLGLFECAFPALEVGKERCVQCGRVVYHTFDKEEVWWEGLLSDIKGSGTEGQLTVLRELLEAEGGENDCASAGFTAFVEGQESLGPDLCWKCSIMQRIYGDGYARDKI